MTQEARIRAIGLGSLVIAFGAAALPAQADSVRHSPGAMRVVVVDAGGTGLPGAEVELPLLEVKFAVPQGGRLLINHVPAGMYVVQVRRLGYTMQTRLVNVRRDTAHVQFALERIAAELDTVNVNAPGNLEMRDFERRLRAGHGRFYSAKDIEKTNAVLLTQFLATVPGVHLRATSGGYSAQSPLGSGGACPSGVLVYLDGVPINALEGGDPSRAVKSIAPGAAAPRPPTVVPAPRSGTAPAPAAMGPGSVQTAQALAAMSAGAAPDPLRSSGALPAFDINSISVTQLAAMEVYPEGAPPQLFYANVPKCGVVLLWSKPK